MERSEYKLLSELFYQEAREVQRYLDLSKDFIHDKEPLRYSLEKYNEHRIKMSTILDIIDKLNNMALNKNRRRST